MKKILCIPDSFKGTMSSKEICTIMEQSIHTIYPSAQVISIPVADGGEGSVDAFLAAVGGYKKALTVTGPLFEKVDAFYGVIDNGDTAVIEMAACAGLPLVGDKKDPRNTTTYGVGQLMAHAIKHDCKKIIMGLGGSATNDGGTGAACALGVKFLNAKGERFIPVGGTLKDITHIDVSCMLPEFSKVEIVTMCDIDNPMYGSTGAAAVFGPQKGATPQMVIELDKGLQHIAEVIKADLGKDVANIPGSGAAGGMGGGMVAFFNSYLQMGIETVLNAVHFNELLQGTDIVFSGEGKIDSQSIRGKVVIGVAKRAKAANVPLIAVVGDIGDNIEDAYDKGITAIFSINRVAVNYKVAKTRSKSDLALTMNNLMRFIQNIK